MHPFVVRDGEWLGCGEVVGERKDGGMIGTFHSHHGQLGLLSCEEEEMGAVAEIGD